MTLKAYWASQGMAFLLWTQAIGQAIPGINYQGVARDLGGNPKASQSISIKISILSGSPSGSIEYSEIHDLKTNQFGLFSLVIGQGNPETGTFAFIDWSNTNKWLQIEMDSEGGSRFELIGSQQLLSVPFAYFAAQAGQGMSVGEGLEIRENVISNTAQDQVVAITAEGSLRVEGEYPNFTLIGTDSINDLDFDPSNEVITGIELGSDHRLRITEAGVNREVDLSPIASGGGLPEVLGLDNSAGGNRITNLSDPAAPQDAVTRNYVDLLNLDDADANPANELLTGAALVGTNLEITDGGGTKVVDLSSLSATGTDDQTLAEVLLSGNSANGNPITNLGAPTANSDAATKEYVDNLDVNDPDANPANEIQDLQLIGNNLQITNNSSPTTIDLSGYLDNTDEQNLSNTVLGTSTTINITGGTGTTFSVADNDNDASNEIQDLQLVGDDLEITNNTSATTIDLSTYLDNTDNQTLNNVLNEGNSAGSGNISDLADPVNAQDAATKNYVDAADAAATNSFAFRVDFSFDGPIGIPTLIDFDNQTVQINISGVISGTNYTAPVDGIYVFYVTATSDSDIPMTVLKNGSAPEVRSVLRSAPIDAFSPVPYSGVFMFSLAMGETVQLRVDNASALENVTGSFFGYRL